MKRDKAAEAILRAEMNARDWGREYFRQYPDLMLVDVAREGAERFEDKHQQIAFLQGYSEARIAHDEYKRGE